MNFRTFLMLTLLLCPFSLPAKTYTWGIIGDAGKWTHEAKLVRNSLRKSKISNLILPGDNIYDEVSHYKDVWKHWPDFNLEIVAIGNHHQGYDNEVKYFKMPGEYYSKVIDGKIRFIVLNSDNWTSPPEQAQWLKRTLQNTNEPFVWVVFHHPPYTISERHNWEERWPFHQAIRPVLRKYRQKLTGLIVGHDHVASLVELGGNFPLVVSGAVMETTPSKPVDYIDPTSVSVKTGWLYKKDPHWVRMDIDTKAGHTWLNFVNAKQDKVACSVRIKDMEITYRENCQKNQIKIRQK